MAEAARRSRRSRKRAHNLVFVLRGGLGWQEQGRNRPSKEARSLCEAARTTESSALELGSLARKATYRKRRGSSISSLSLTRKVTASLPSSNRWSYLRFCVQLQRASLRYEEIKRT